MTAQYENGFDYFPTSVSMVTFVAQLNAEGWYFPQGTTLPNTNPIITPGRYGYGNRIGITASVLTPTLLRPFLPIRQIPNTSNGFTSIGMRIEEDNQHPPTMFVYDLVNNLCLCSISFDINGVVSAWRGFPISGTLLGRSDAGVWRYGVDFDVEVHWVISTTVGEIEVRFHTIGNGTAGGGSTPALHLTGQNTQPGTSSVYDGAGFGQVFNGSGVGGATTGVIDVKWDDFRVYNNSGSVNNTWLGTNRVQTLMPAGDGATVNFTRSNTSLAHWQNIINQNIDDSLYLYDPTVGDLNLMTPTPLVNAAPPIAWVGMLGYYRQDDATQHFVKQRIVSSGTNGDGASFATPQTYSGDHDIYETDPHTSAAFTAAAVNALQFGPLFFA